MSSKEVKINENKVLNEIRYNEKNTTKFNRDYNNFNEQVNNTLNQQQDAINKTLDNTLHNIKKSTDEARREIPQYTQRIAEYQEKTIQTIRDIASDFIEAEKQIVNSFQSHKEGNNCNVNFSNGLWDLYNPQKIAENHTVIINNLTSYLLNTNNLINNALASNMRIYNTALEQTRDNVKTLAKTNTSSIKSTVEQESINRHNKEENTTTNL
ncbi:MAG TPA: hypothetical protein VFK40_03770 [Nitrososphaeraceae archaeon]|nr:hypothetical protein [Nitrososphaeraceae archaeon]